MEDMALLKKISFFKDLGRRKLRQINMLVERSAFRAGEEIVKEGTPCDAIYIIKEGSVKVVKGRRHIVDIGKGEPVGEISFIDKGLRSASVIALEDTVLIKIPAGSFEKLLAREKDLASNIYKSVAETLCHRLRETNEVLKLIV